MSSPSTNATAPQQGPLADLLQRTAKGDRAAFAEAYRALSPQLFSLATRMLKRKDLAEEVLQEAFVIVWTKASSFDPGKGTPSAWAASILRNRCIDRLRLRQLETAIEDERSAADWADSSPSPLDLTLRSADARALGACLDRLEPGPRSAIMRVYYEGLTHAELADRTAVPLGTLKSWVRRGLMRLKECLDG